MKTIPQLILACFILATMFFSAYLFETGMFGLMPQSLKTQANRLITTCSRETYPPACYDREIPKLMDKGLSMEEAFEVARIIQEKTGDYYFCHVLGHNLSAKETAKDPSKWTDVIAQCPVGVCSNGCLHGAAQERYRDDVLSEEEIEAVLPELATTCTSGGSRDFTGLEEASCDHSLGHLAMYMTGADPIKATAICDVVAKKYAVTCYEGVFMQIFQPLEPEDFGLVKDIPATTIVSAKAYCDRFTGVQRTACHRESWPLYHLQIKEPAGLASFCTLVPDEESVNACYYGMFYVLTAQFHFDKERVSSFCSSLGDRKSQCFANSASRFLETDYALIPDAVSLCEAAEKEGVGKRCFNELLYYSGFGFHKGSDAFNTLCHALPEPWRTRCKDGEGSTVRLNEGL